MTESKQWVSDDELVAMFNRFSQIHPRKPDIRMSQEAIYDGWNYSIAFGLFYIQVIY
tara:strand:- start:53 stop:223 length:171 start_codon:yes stop_codon:yes gene_type:complete